MKKVNLIGWAFMIILLSFMGCRTDIIEDTTIKTTDEPTILVNSSVSGIVSNESGEAIDGAIVSINGESINTNEYGFFTFKNKTIDAAGQVLKISKPGYFELTKIFMPHLNTTSYLSIQLMDKIETGSFNSSAGGTISTSEGASVRFEADVIMREDGSVYVGVVRVFSKWVNPKANNIASIMPGDLRGKNTDLEQVQLATYGMMVVELESDSGEKLQVKTGNKATLTFPIPIEMQSSAPNEIPLWSMDENTGYWIEESVAKLENGQYTGDVTHFSFWNCDVPNDYIQLSGKLIDASGNPIAWASIGIESQNAGTAYGWSDSNGNFSGFVPQDELLVFRILTNCGDIIYEVELGPYSADIMLDDIILDENNNLVQFSGTLLDCNGSPLSDGYVLFNNGNHAQYFETQSDGTFNQSLFVCETLTGFIRGYDYTNLLVTDYIEYTVNPGDVLYNFGSIEVCEELTEYVTIVTDKPYEQHFMKFEANISPNGFSLHANVTTDSIYLNIVSPVMMGETGSFDISQFFHFNEGEQISLSCSGNGGPTGCPSIEITKNEGSGGYIEGSVTGEFEESNMNGSVTLVEGTITFKVLLE